MTRLGSFQSVSLGPGDPELLTLKALHALEKADCIFTVQSANGKQSFSDSILAHFPQLKAERIPLIVSMSRSPVERQAATTKNAKIIQEKIQQGLNCTLAIIGDSLTYGTSGYILRHLQKEVTGIEVQAIPGVNSWSSLNSLFKNVLVEDEESLHILPSYDPNAHLEKSLELLREGNTVVFLKTFRERNSLIESLKKRAPSLDFFYGEKIGYPEEFTTQNPAEIITRPLCYLSLLIVRKPK